MKTQLEEIRIKVSEIKKGDRFTVGNSTHQAQSDAYLESVWTVDIFGGYTYGFTSNGDHKITVRR